MEREGEVGPWGDLDQFKPRTGTGKELWHQETSRFGGAAILKPRRVTNLVPAVGGADSVK